MASVNKVILVGNLGADPEVRYMPSGDAVAKLRQATTDRYKDKQSGEKSGSLPQVSPPAPTPVVLTNLYQ